MSPPRGRTKTNRAVPGREKNAEPRTPWRVFPSGGRSRRPGPVSGVPHNPQAVRVLRGQFSHTPAVFGRHRDAFFGFCLLFFVFFLWLLFCVSPGRSCGPLRVCAQLAPQDVSPTPSDQVPEYARWLSFRLRATAAPSFPPENPQDSDAEEMWSPACPCRIRGESKRSIAYQGHGRHGRPTGRGTSPTRTARPAGDHPKKQAARVGGSRGSHGWDGATGWM